MTKIGGIAETVTAVIAFFSLLFAWCTVNKARDAQREATAKDVYRDYLKLAFDNPDLANPPPSSKADDLHQREKYRWFVAFMLNSCDEIARTRWRDQGWRNTILEDLKMHVEYLRSREFAEDGGWRLYSQELRDIFEKL